MFDLNINFTGLLYSIKTVSSSSTTKLGIEVATKVNTGLIAYKYVTTKKFNSIKIFNPVKKVDTVVNINTNTKINKFK